MTFCDSGFVYLWFDRKHKRYYVGSHWGNPDDGYICSSNWMRDAYNRRPQDFKRRILKTITTSRKDLLEEENRYLSMIKDHELRVRYYNLSIKHFNHWTAENNLSVRQKISKSRKGKGTGKREGKWLDNIQTAVAKQKENKVGMYGLTPEQKSENARKAGSKPWITNGIINKKLPKNGIMPEGFRFGRLVPKEFNIMGGKANATKQMINKTGLMGYNVNVPFEERSRIATQNIMSQSKEQRQINASKAGTISAMKFKELT